MTQRPGLVAVVLRDYDADCLIHAAASLRPLRQSLGPNQADGTPARAWRLGRAMKVLVTGSAGHLGAVRAPGVLIRWAVAPLLLVSCERALGT